MASNVEGYEQNLCVNTIKDIADININILKAGIDNFPENVIFYV